VPDSVQTITDSYEYDTGTLIIRYTLPLYPLTLDFDENGNFLNFWGRSYDDDERAFIMVLHRGDNRTLTGMIYRVAMPEP
jgi:hypothetical protein